MATYITKYYLLFVVCLLCVAENSNASIIYVGNGKPHEKIKPAIAASREGDTIIVDAGVYKEGNITLDKRLVLLGRNMPVLDGEFRYEIISVRSSNVTIKGFQIRNSGKSSTNDPAAVKVYDSDSVRIEGNLLIENYFGIYLQYAGNCIIKDNVIKASQTEEHKSGNGIHCWKSDSLQVIGNRVSGHRDGIYFEFVTNSVVWRNISRDNLRYGLHFMFSHQNGYFTNHFKNNGAGVAVMFTKKVVMMNNTFEENWGAAAYGLLLKELSDCHISGNRFIQNTIGIFFDGSNRIAAERNIFKANGWAMRMQANCVDNRVERNNFQGNTFDVATNGTLTLNHFNENYWDRYEGYDMDKDKTGDIPYRPLSLYAVIVEKNPPAMLLYRSFMIGLLDKSEKILPSLTPENFIDNNPQMHPYPL